uniref:Uncharacterized protein LOC104246316 n=1 Tax=Nicotiana sylvestris TaxID=4096 RepID=A0A1U7YME4_NICSY|nr:PREDICTED: uncharacterized protein LOC104246316 [Nicotiana sylvestris]
MHYSLPYKPFILLLFFFYTTMTLNCLTCQVLKRTDSEDELRERFNNVHQNSPGKSNFRLFSGKIERNWSGNLVPKPRFEKTRGQSLLGKENTAKKGCHRIHNSCPMEFLTDSPKLVRSSGMRRDWSFEDLRQIIKR